MLHVHTKGIGVAGVFPFEIAETKVHQVVAVRARARDAAAGIAAKEPRTHEHAEPELETGDPPGARRRDRRAGTSSRGSSTCCWRCWPTRRPPRSSSTAAGRSTRLAGKLEEFLDKEIKPLPEDERERAQPTLGVRARGPAGGQPRARRREGARPTAPNVLVAMFSEPESHAVAFLKEEGITPAGRGQLHLARHLQAAAGQDAGAAGQGAAASADDDDEGEEAPADPLAAFAVNLNERARAGEIDPLIGRAPQVERALHVLARRRKNNPLFVGDAGVGKTAIVEGLARRIELGEAPRGADGRGHLRAGHGRDGGGDALPRRLRGALQGGDEGAGGEGERHRLHRRAAHHRRRGRGVGRRHGRVEPDQAGAGRRASCAASAPRRTRSTAATSRRTGRWRGGSSRSRSRSRRIDETIKVLRGLRARYEEFHGVTYTDKALRAAAELSSRYLHDRRLPDKAIDLIDEAGAALKLKGRRKSQAATRRVTQQGHRDGAWRPWRASRPSGSAPTIASGWRTSKASSRPRSSARTAAVERVAQAIKMNRAGLGLPAAADRQLPVRGADRRRQDRAGQAAGRDRWASASCASTCRSTWSGTRCRA